MSTRTKRFHNSPSNAAWSRCRAVVAWIIEGERERPGLPRADFSRVRNPLPYWVGRREQLRGFQGFRVMPRYHKTDPPAKVFVANFAISTAPASSRRSATVALTSITRLRYCPTPHVVG